MAEKAYSAGGPVVVTGANGFVGARTCQALVDRGCVVDALVRRAGTAPAIGGVREVLGDPTDPAVAGALEGAAAVVSTVHPLYAKAEVQRHVGVEGTRVLAEAAVRAGVPLLVHVSTAAAYARPSDGTDITEASDLVADDATAYAVSKRDGDAALEATQGITRVLVRPPAILGSGPTSVWNTIRPGRMARSGRRPRTNPGAAFAWVHVDDLAAFLADTATTGVAADPQRGPVSGACTPVNVAAGTATEGDYVRAVSQALGTTPEWTDDSAWHGHYRTDLAAAWGWRPVISLESALAELAADVRGLAAGANRQEGATPSV